MVRSSLPEPVGGRFGIVAKALLALAKCLLGPLAVLDIGRRAVPFDNVAQLIAQRLGLEQTSDIHHRSAGAELQAHLAYRTSVLHSTSPTCSPCRQGEKREASPPRLGPVRGRCSRGLVD